MNRILDELSGAAGLAATVLFSPLLRPRYSVWGSNEIEAGERLPGDELVSGPALQSTRAISIASPPSEVWPWLAQMGQGRGGLYSYQGLENILGCKMHNVSHVHPELQALQIGDEIRNGPPGYPYWRVVGLERGRLLVLRACDPHTGEFAPSTWTFVLRALDGGQGTRLIVRSRIPRRGFAWRRLVDPASFVFERRMLLGIRDRAEKAYLS